ncbi:SRPBCC family protein [Haloferacaceae archaeon DSL9]
MREVTASRFMRATPPALAQVITPSKLVGYEGTFRVLDVEAGDEESETVVTVGGGGMRFRLRFESREDGLYYAQLDDEGPFDELETWLFYRAKDDGSRVTMRSNVSLSVPIPGVDRIAAWKRKNELRRALDALADDV